MREFFMELSLFEGGAGGGAGAGAAGAGAAQAAGADGGSEAAVVTPGTLEDGTQVDNRLAARMEEQARKRRARGEEPKQTAAVKAPEQTEEPAAEEQAEPSLEDQWAEAKKGKFKELIGRDIQAAIQDRFKNQKAASDTLARLEPALNVLAQQRGIAEGDWDALTENIMNDDSLLEEEAERLGMTVEGARDYLAMEAENKRFKEEQAREQEEMFLRQHFENLARQGEELRKTFPDFNLQKELENETFRRLTLPNSGLTVEAAYYAVHHRELEPQAMAYGIQRAQQQMSQTLQANRQRPVEGAMKTAQPADIAMDPRTMSREQRQKLIERARRGEKIII